ncbi:GNAT family N-acetyltransferase [Ruminococcus sp. 5_1_39BFAA]|uniref:GNAT family N-acetyltransferase n=1 Tax=Ruminococcus sp. 5_1_39BFAA TaxID=457412 RepID=UPI00356A2EE7
MLYKEEKFIGKNGSQYILKSPEISDAEKVIHYLKTSAQETEYGISYPEEMDFSIKDEEDFITRFADDKKSIMISVFEGDTLVGGASLTSVLDKRKTRHRATFGIAMLKSAWGQGLGYKILSELIAFAKKAGYEQIELEVVSSNLPAINLYKKLGFVVYGERPRSFKLKNGNYSDELLMVLALK